MNETVKIGTCGFHTTKEEYALKFSVVEIQQTFYQPPQIKTLEKWRDLMPPNFEFTLKAWQLITHEAKSPTYKRLKSNLTDKEKADTGYFKPSSIVAAAWETTRACALALQAKTILFQCPASFKENRENIANLKKFFETIERRDFNFAWEPRGDWDPSVIKDICEDLQLWHAVDPFSIRTVTPENCYYRLHGRQGFRYKYDEEELTELIEMLPPNKPAYIFFNNKYMIEDALMFKKLAGF